VADGGALAQFLIQRARTCREPPILFPTSDAFVVFASEHRDALEPYLAHALPSQAAVAAAMDKRQQHLQALAANVPVVPTVWPSTGAQVRALAPELSYPLVVKPPLLRRRAHRRARRGG
jgi:predicted ATP-grasp superfamily ATP-dependent carboligase